jgi:hypothetical protein
MYSGASPVDGASEYKYETFIYRRYKITLSDLARRFI